MEEGSIISKRARKNWLKFVTHIAFQSSPSVVKYVKNALKLFPSDAQSAALALPTIFGDVDYSYWMDRHNPSQLIRTEEIMDGKIVTVP